MVATSSLLRDESGAGAMLPAALSARVEQIVWLLGDSTVLGFDVPLGEMLDVQLEEHLEQNGSMLEVCALGFGGAGLGSGI